MGMYTELVCAMELKKDVPEQVVEILKYMLDYDDQPIDLPDHELFKTTRWDWMLRSSSFYFSGKTYSDLSNHYGNYFLTIRCDLKNYDNEIDKFIDWIAPYSNDRGFVGYKRYEEDADPELIYI